VRRFSPELEEIFTGRFDLEEFYRQADSAPKVSPSVNRRPFGSSEKTTSVRKRPPNLTEYICSIKELGKVEKLILQLVTNAYVRGAVYQARIGTIRGRASCGRATVFRALTTLVPKYMVKISRPGKPNILKPSPLLLKYLGLSPKFRGLAREEALSSLSRGMTKCHRITGMFKHSPRT